MKPGGNSAQEAHCEPGACTFHPRKGESLQEAGTRQEVNKHCMRQGAGWGVLVQVGVGRLWRIAHTCFLRKERELGGWGGKEEPKVTATLKSSHPGGLERWFND